MYELCNILILDEMMLIIMNILIACGFYAYAINEIGFVLQKMQREKDYNDQILLRINAYMDNKKISNDLQYQIRAYLEYYLKESKQTNSELDSKIFSMLSDPLKKQLMIESNKIVLKDSPIFKTNFTDNVIEKTVSFIQEINFPPDEYVFQRGHTSNEVYFIQKGKIEIYFDNCKTGQKYPLKILSAGECFGIREFFTGEAREFNVRSKEFTTLLLIRREDFLQIVKQSPDDYEIFCYIKDGLLQKRYNDKIGLRCICCSSFLHSTTTCPYVHYVPNNLKIIFRENNDKTVQNGDKTFLRRNRPKIRPIMQSIDIQESAGLFVDQNESFLNKQDWTCKDIALDEYEVIGDPNLFTNQFIQGVTNDQYNNIINNVNYPAFNGINNNNNSSVKYNLVIKQASIPAHLRNSPNQFLKWKSQNSVGDIASISEIDSSMQGFESIKFGNQRGNNNNHGNNSGNKRSSTSDIDNNINKDIEINNAQENINNDINQGENLTQENEQDKGSVVRAASVKEKPITKEFDSFSDSPNKMKQFNNTNNTNNTNNINNNINNNNNIMRNARSPSRRTTYITKNQNANNINNNYMTYQNNHNSEENMVVYKRIGGKGRKKTIFLNKLPSMHIGQNQAEQNIKIASQEMNLDSNNNDGEHQAVTVLTHSKSISGVNSGFDKGQIGLIPYSNFIGDSKQNLHFCHPELLDFESKKEYLFYYPQYNPSKIISKMKRAKNKKKQYHNKQTSFMKSMNSKMQSLKSQVSICDKADEEKDYKKMNMSIKLVQPQGNNNNANRQNPSLSIISQTYKNQQFLGTYSKQGQFIINDTKPDNNIEDN